MTAQTLALGALLALSSALALSAVTPEEASQLGKALTPMGAERAANASGSIPAWDGGIRTAPAGFKEGGHYIDPFSQDRILFTIDTGNVDRYSEQLSPGQMALVKKYPGWKMNVYTTRRSASFPEAHYRETVSNATRANLAEGGNGVVGARAEFPSPFPRTASR